MEGDIIHHLFVGVDGVIHIPVFDLHGHVADFHALPLREAVGDLTAHHAFDDPVLADIVCPFVKGFDGMAVPDHGDVVGHIGDLVELVRDDDGGQALLLEPQQQIQQRLGVRLVQRGSRLVQDQQLGILCQRLGDFHQLLLAHADVLDQRVGGFRQAHGTQVLGGLGMGLVPVDGKGFALFVAQEHILCNGHLGHQGKLLMDDDNALGFAVLDFGEFADLSIVDNVAGIGAVGINTAEDLHQRGFTGAVLTDQRVDGAALHHQVHVVKGLDTGKLLGDVFHFQNNVRQVTASVAWNIMRIHTSRGF